MFLQTFVLVLLVCLVLVNILSCEEERMVAGPNVRSREFVLDARRAQYEELVRRHNASEDPFERQDIERYLGTIRAIAHEKGEHKRLLHGMPGLR